MWFEVKQNSCSLVDSVSEVNLDFPAPDVVECHFEFLCICSHLCNHNMAAVYCTRLLVFMKGGCVLLLNTPHSDWKEIICILSHNCDMQLYYTDVRRLLFKHTDNDCCGNMLNCKQTNTINGWVASCVRSLDFMIISCQNPVQYLESANTETVDPTEHPCRTLPCHVWRTVCRLILVAIQQYQAMQLDKMMGTLDFKASHHKRA